jgi:glycosyltransferase involved in cell wall biosynthesis
LSARFGIYMPAYNAAQTLPGVIERIPPAAWSLCDDVVIVDDGSTDDTAAIIDALAVRHAAIRRISFSRNQGYGAAVRAGLTALAETPVDYYACLHADGQYPPEMLEPFVRHATAARLDVLQGSRHLHGTARRGGMPFYKLLAGHALCAMENAVFGLQLTDYHSGYLVVSRRVIERIDIEKLSGYFDFDLEMIAAARQRGLTIGELGIPTHYGNEVSYLNPAVYGVRVLVVLGKYLLGVYR